MQQRYEVPVSGAAVALEDVETFAQQAAHAEDYIFGRLFPLAAGTKGVIPWGTPTSNKGIVRPKSGATSRVLVSPFTFLLGPISPTAGDDGVVLDGRSHVYIGTSVDNANETEVTIDASAGSARWDLIWARMDRDASMASVQRVYKDAGGVVSSGTYTVYRHCPVTIGVTKGVETATPVFPALPADSGSQYYVPLAYVKIIAGHTLTTNIPANRVQEHAPTVPVSRRTGSASARPASSQFNPTGPIIQSATGGIPTGTSRPRAYIPSTALGEEVRFIALGFSGNLQGRSIPLETDVIVDDSVDWRNRVFLTHWYTANPTLGGDFAWTSSSLVHLQPYHARGAAASGTDLPAARQAWGISNSFKDTTVSAGHQAGFAAPTAHIATIYDTVIDDLATGSYIMFGVDMTTGALMVKTGTTDPNVILFGWIRATGAFAQTWF